MKNLFIKTIFFYVMNFSYKNNLYGHKTTSSSHISFEKKTPRKTFLGSSDLRTKIFVWCLSSTFPTTCRRSSQILEFFRMDKPRFDQLVEKIRPVIEKCSNRECISVEESLSITLRFLATGMV